MVVCVIFKYHMSIDLKTIKHISKESKPKEEKPKPKAKEEKPKAKE